MGVRLWLACVHSFKALTFERKQYLLRSLWCVFQHYRKLDKLEQMKQHHNSHWWCNIGVIFLHCIKRAWPILHFDQSRVALLSWGDKETPHSSSHPMYHHTLFSKAWRLEISALPIFSLHVALVWTQVSLWTNLRPVSVKTKLLITKNKIKIVSIQRLRKK